MGRVILRRDDCLIRHGANSIRRDLRDKRGLHFEVKASFSHEKEAFCYISLKGGDLMTTIKTSNLGFPRIGLNREWKKALEAYWKGNTDKETFLKSLTVYSYQLSKHSLTNISISCRSLISLIMIMCLIPPSALTGFRKIPQHHGSR